MDSLWLYKGNHGHSQLPGNKWCPLINLMWPQYIYVDNYVYKFIDRLNDSDYTTVLCFNIAQEDKITFPSLVANYCIKHN